MSLSKGSKRFLVKIATVTALLIFTVTLVGAVYYNPDGIPLPKGSSSTTKRSASLYPVHISIPKIKVDTSVVQVGVTQKGNMATPSDFSEVGWYKYGTIPGQKGSAILAGHVDNGLAFPAVFSNLKNLKNGDSIYVTTKKNKRLRFVVTGAKVYDFNASAKAIFNDKSGTLLKLITCSGNWVSEYKTHDKRLVVTAQLVK
ncbi:class F sortase [Candidatus Nomurabacteria bacterium]|nr:class F sortase [Candidatus Nomurabacteria bacterium]